jgi:hypothetical protein
VRYRRAASSRRAVPESATSAFVIHRPCSDQRPDRSGTERVMVALSASSAFITASVRLTAYVVLRAVPPGSHRDSCSSSSLVRTFRSCSGAVPPDSSPGPPDKTEPVPRPGRNPNGDVTETRSPLCPWNSPGTQPTGYSACAARRGRTSRDANRHARLRGCP